MPGKREAAIQVGASPLSSVATASCVGVSMVLGLLATLFLDFLRWIGVTSLLLPPWFLGMPIPFLCYPVPWFLGLLGFVVLGSCVNDLIPPLSSASVVFVWYKVPHSLSNRIHPIASNERSW